MKEKFPENFGSIVVEGVEQASFWIRAFKLEGQIDLVRKKIEEKPERKQATAPIVGHYVVDAKLTWYYAISFDVDALGTQNMIGKIWYCSPEHRDKAIKSRDVLANAIMEELDKKSKRVAGEMIDPGFEWEIENYEPKKESGENPPPDKSR
jgi:hypothetical protein